MHDLFPEKVRLDQESHKYTHDNGDEYVGFTKVFEYISKPFFRGVAKKVAANENISVTEVQERWDGQRDEGSRIDDVLTHYCQTGELKDEKMKGAVEQILSHYKGYHKTYEQLVVYNEEYRTATAIDKLVACSNRKDGLCEIGDFKCFEKMDLFSGTGWLKEPFAHLPDTKFIKTAFQLSYGALHFEMLTGRKCKKLFIHMIQPSTIYNEIVNQQIIQVPYLKTDVIKLLEMNKENILNDLTPKEQNVF